jgi:predicted dehydrogenase
MRPLRILLIGCGYIAQAEHIPSWTQSPSGRLIGVADRREGLAQEIGERLAVPWFTDPDAALAACDCDAVHICTPPETHPSLIRSAAKAGRHILVEKPLAVDSAAASAVAADARAARVVCMVGYHRLFDTDFAELGRRIHVGDLGQLQGIQSVWKLSLPPVWPGRDTWPRTTLAPPGMAGAALLRHLFLDQSIHHLSLIRRWAGEVVRVESVQRAGSLWHVTLTFAGDLPVWHTLAGPIGHGEEIRVYAEEGIYDASPWSPHFPWTFGSSRFARKTGEVIIPALARINPYGAQAEEFVAAVREGRAPAADAGDAVEDIRLVERIVARFEAEREP